MHPNRRWRTLRSRARSSRVHHASDPVFVHRPAALDWASSRPRLAATPLPFSLPSALRKPGHRTSTYEVTRHARRTRKGEGRRAGIAGTASQRRSRASTGRLELIRPTIYTDDGAAGVLRGRRTLTDDALHQRALPIARSSQVLPR